MKIYVLTRVMHPAADGSDGFDPTVETFVYGTWKQLVDYLTLVCVANEWIDGNSKKVHNFSIDSSHMACAGNDPDLSGWIQVQDFEIELAFTIPV